MNPLIAVFYPPFVSVNIFFYPSLICSRSIKYVFVLCRDCLTPVRCNNCFFSDTVFTGFVDISSLVWACVCVSLCANVCVLCALWRHWWFVIFLSNRFTRPHVCLLMCENQRDIHIYKPNTHIHTHTEWLLLSLTAGWNPYTQNKQPRGGNSCQRLPCSTNAFVAQWYFFIFSL